MGCFTSNFGFPDYFWELSRLYPGNLQPFYLLQAFYLLYLGNIYAIYPIFTLYGLFANNLHAIYRPPFLDSAQIYCVQHHTAGFLVEIFNSFSVLWGGLCAPFSGAMNETIKGPARAGGRRPPG